MAETKLGLVLSAGGARAAYQVGVLKYVAEHFPNFRPRIFCGVSAGSINATFLSQGDPIETAIPKLYSVWRSLTFDEVFKTNFNSMLSMGLRWGSDLFVSKVTRRLLLKSFLDASPLSRTLLSHIHFWKISKAIQAGRVDGLSVIATNYHDGCSTIFYESHLPIPPWYRESRRSMRTLIRVRHVMASCSIPILFEPVRIGDHLFGDGSLRFNFPLSPAIQLGANRLFAISIRSAKPDKALVQRSPESLGMGFIAGAVLNSIFLDSLEADFETLTRFNELAEGGWIKKVPGLLLRPSVDLGSLAKEHLDEVPFHLRQLLKATASPAELGDLLSYLMFSQQYLRRLLELGENDAAAQHAHIEKFLAL